MSTSQTFLTIDTALGQCSAALHHKSKIFSTQGTSKQSQAVQMMGLIEKVLADAAMTYHDLSTIYVCVGPGTFTGIRIGVSVARTLRLALTIPCYGIGSLDMVAQAHAASVDGKFQIVLRAGKKQVYHQLFQYDGGQLMHSSDAQITDITALDTRLPSCGNAHKDAPNLNWMEPSATPFAQALIHYTLNQKENTFLPPEPFYIRPPDAIAAAPLFPNTQEGVA